MFREIRRKDRILDNELAIRLLEEAEYGFLAMSGINGYGYGIPINYVKEGDSIYFHCAPEGYKLECLRENPKVSFTVSWRYTNRSGKIHDRLREHYRFWRDAFGFAGRRASVCLAATRE